jgi:hypothetical protein
MRLTTYKLMYFNLLLIFLYLNHIFILFLIILCFFQLHNRIGRYSDIYYELNMVQLNDFINIKYLEYEVSQRLEYTSENEDFYLFFNCNFFFLFHGGSQITNFTDFVDIEIYKFDNLKNLKNIYYSLDYINKKEA